MNRTYRSIAALFLALFVTSTAFGQVQQQSVALVATTTDKHYGDILVTTRGYALYLLTSDSSTESHCTGNCATAWPPLVSQGEPEADKGVSQNLLDTVARDDGETQVTYNGHPLYTFTKDTAAGDTSGQGLKGPGGTWLLVSLTGEPVTKAAVPTSASNDKARQPAGDSPQDESVNAENPEAQAPTSITQAGFQGSYEFVTDERLLNPEPENWLMYKRSYDLQGYSPLDQITTENIAELVPVWAFGTGVSDGHEAPPIVNGDMMFVTGPFNTLFALDARTGNQIWEYRRPLAEDVAPEVCCGMVNRGVALYGEKAYLATLDAHLLAFDVRTGEILWDRPVEDYLTGYTMTLAPLAVNGKIIVGVAGGERGIRGFIAAYDSETGEEVWKTYTVPGPGEPGNETWPGDTWKTGGASIWVTGSYDPDLNLTYWGTGNAAPWMGDTRPGDNYYVASVVALDVNSGEIKSHYQYVPNDSWDYDETSDQTLVDIERDGKMVQGLIHVGRNGYFYLLDRTNLDFIYGVPYTEAQPRTITGFEDDGRPIIPAEHTPALGKAVDVCPALGGANNWFGLAFSPQTGYAYLPTMEYCMTISGTAVEYRAGKSFTGADIQQYPPEGFDMLGSLQAVDVATGEIVWKHEQQMPVRSPVMPTAGGLVFSGDIFDREFRAYDAATGDILWRFKTNSSVLGVPVSYELDGVQYVAVQAGFGGVGAGYITRAADALGVPFTPVSGGTVWVFALPTPPQP